MSEPRPSGVLARSARRAALIDAGIGLLVALLLWPFPVARRVLPVTGNVAGILLLGYAATLVLAAAALRRWHRTLGMRLAGVALMSGRARRSFRAELAFVALCTLVTPLGWALALFDPEHGVASRGSGLSIVGESHDRLDSDA